MAVDSIAVTGAPQLTGDVTLSEGAGVTLTQVGQDIEIASSLASGPPPDRIMTVASQEFSTSAFVRATETNAAVAWPSVNDPLAIPFAISSAMTVTHLGWLNGSAPADNFDVGVYDTAFERLVSTGSTVRVGANVWQYVNVADTPLVAGRYYLAASSDGVSVNQQLWSTAGVLAGVMAFAGIFDSATNSFPLPDPLANMAAAATFTRIPYLSVCGRAPF
ncbi:MAG: hypothetical protein L0191_09820 [Acidobacteria bacterium]|nr:hypothetical protein [Acidobacteriota bacterium]